MSSKEETRAKGVKKKGRKGVLIKQPTISILSQYKEGSMSEGPPQEIQNLSLGSFYGTNRLAHGGRGR
jgi:hypothetical protein